MFDFSVFMQWALFIAFAALCCWAMASDLRTLLIDNWVSIVLALMFLPAALLVGQGWSVIGWHYAIGAAFLVGGFVLFALGVIGGGDIKFAAATVIWLGPALAGGFLFLIAILGGGLAAFALLGRRVSLPSFLARLPWLKKGGAEAGIPYGIAIGLAGIYGVTRTPLGVSLGLNAW